MAQKTVGTVVCDLPHDDEIAGIESVSFGFDGNAYEIDLCETHSKELHEKVGAFLDPDSNVACDCRSELSSPISSLSPSPWRAPLLRRNVPEPMSIDFNLTNRRSILASEKEFLA